MASLTAASTDRMMFGALYVAVGLVTLWAGFRIANEGLELRFINNYLKQWEVGVLAYSVQHGKWPVFKGNNHVAYMEELTRWMRHSGVQPPQSNTHVSYRYRFERFTGENEDVFLLCFTDRIVLFGISENTLNRLDKAVDRRLDLGRGRVTGRLGKNETTYIGQLKL